MELAHEKTRKNTFTTPRWLLQDHAVVNLPFCEYKEVLPVVVSSDKAVVDIHLRFVLIGIFWSYSRQEE